MIKTDPDKIKEILTRGVEEVINKESLEGKLLSGKQLRIKLGIDPTAPGLHLGHTVVLRKMKAFQNLGHKIVLIIGDFTGRIGDPSSRDSARKPLLPKEIKENLKGYLAQAGKIIDIKKAEFKYNDRWFSKEKIIELATVGTIQQMTERADFAKRIKSGNAVRLIETLYPLFQGYDSVEVRADVELGGTDQKFNLLAGRMLFRHYGKPEQDVIMLPLLEGTDGVKKMSKSTGNYIALNDTPQDMYGKLMAIPDNLIDKYIRLLTDLDGEKIGEDNSNPRDKKAVLAKEIVRMYHGEKEAQKAEDAFNKTFRDKNPTFIEYTVDESKIFYPELISKIAGISTSEAKRLIISGAVEINSGVDKDWKKDIYIDEEGIKIKVGKKVFIKVKLS